MRITLLTELAIFDLFKPYIMRDEHSIVQQLLALRWLGI